MAQYPATVVETEDEITLNGEQLLVNGEPLKAFNLPDELEYYNRRLRATETYQDKVRRLRNLGYI
jgi:hypothetical protein